MSLTWILTLLLACAEPDARDTSSCGAEDRPVTWDGYTRGFFLTYCAACHSSSATERYGAPEGVDFDTPQQVLDQAERVRARVLEAQTMPLGGGVPAEDLTLLAEWLDCPR